MYKTKNWTCLDRSSNSLPFMPHSFTVVLFYHCTLSLTTSIQSTNQPSLLIPDTLQSPYPLFLAYYVSRPTSKLRDYPLSTLPTTVPPIYTKLPSISGNRCQYPPGTRNAKITRAINDNCPTTKTAETAEWSKMASFVQRCRSQFTKHRASVKVVCSREQIFTRVQARCVGSRFNP